MILMSVLAGFLGLGTDSTGSFALSKDQSSFFLKHVEDKAAYLAEQFTEQVIKRLVEINFGEREIMPKLAFSPLGDIDFKEMSEVLKTLSDTGLVNKDKSMVDFVHKTFKLPDLPEDFDVPEEPEVPESVPEEKEEASEHLAQKKSLKFFRALTLQEKRVDFRALNEIFNESEGELEKELILAVGVSLERALKSIQNKLKSGDLSGIADLNLISKPALKKAILEGMKGGYEAGKESASSEMDVERPATPTLDSQVMRFQATQIADEFANDINSSAKTVAREGFSKGVKPLAIAVAVNEVMRNRSSKMITNVTGSAVGEFVNRGRRAVYEKNIGKVRAYQRSEILDDRTCNMCMSLDQRIVKADDPMAQMDLVHTHCRGIWVPILTGEEIKGGVGLPKSITDGIETIGGVPAINSFTQLKKPINRANEEVQKEVKRRLKNK